MYCRRFCIFCIVVSVTSNNDTDMVNVTQISPNSKNGINVTQVAPTSNKATQVSPTSNNATQVAPTSSSVVTVTQVVPTSSSGTVTQVASTSSNGVSVTQAPSSSSTKRANLTNLAPERMERVDFEHHITICNFDYKCRGIVNKINCNKKCIKEEQLKQYDFDAFKDKFVDISISQPISLPCEGNEKAVDIHNIIYQSPMTWIEFCPIKMPWDCRNVISDTHCTAPELCNSSVGATDTCDFIHNDVTEELKSECLNQRGSCEVEVPRMMIENYDTCVRDDTEKVVKCTDPTNYCYAKWAVIKYQCLRAGKTTHK